MKYSSIANAASAGNFKTIKEVFDAGEILEPEEINLALYSAIENLQPEVVRLLLFHGADVNAEDEFGITPLHLALDVEVQDSIYKHDVKGMNFSPSTEISEILIAHGANLNAKTNKGETPLQWAIEMKHEAAIKLLRNYAAIEKTVLRLHH